MFLIRGLDKDFVGYFYAVAHTFFYDDGKGDIASMLEYAGDKLKHITIVAVFGEEDRADESSRFMLERVTQELGQFVR